MSSEPGRTADAAPGPVARWAVLIASVLTSAAAVWLLLGSAIPLGVEGEWVWNRVTRPPELARYLVPTLAGVAYVSFVTGGWVWLQSRSERWVILGLPLLLTVAAGLQATILNLPAPGLGLERIPISLYSTASSGYFWHARLHPAQTFVQDYEDWVSKQDRFHIGTHPPGLFLLNRFVLEALGQRPKAAQFLVRHAPKRMREGLQVLGAELQLHEAAALLAVALLTWGASLATALPVYLLARLGEKPAIAWLAAATWPVVPGPLLFYPVSDCLFPFLAATFVWLSVAAIRYRSLLLAIAAGVALWAGLMLSLAFLALLPIPAGCSLLYPYFEVLDRRTFLRQAVRNVVRTMGGIALGVGLCWLAMLAAFDLNMVTVWRINLSKHAGFYDAFPRSYWPWLGINLLEFGTMCGPAAFVASALGLFVSIRSSRFNLVRTLTWCWLGTVILLDLSGKNMSEAARLWLFLTPFAAIGLASASNLLQFRGRHVMLLLACQIAVGLALLGTVEPLLPIAVP